MNRQIITGMNCLRQDFQKLELARGFPRTHWEDFQFSIYHFPMKGIAPRKDLQKQGRSFFFLVPERRIFAKAFFPTKLFYE